VEDDAVGDAAFKAARRTPTFWAIWVTGLLSFTGQVGFLFHEISIFMPRMGLEMAGYAVSITVIAAALGRFVVGWAARIAPLSVVAAAIYLIQATGFVLAGLGTGIPLSFTAAALAGFSVGAVVMLPAMLIRSAFGGLGFGRMFGLASIGMFAGMTIGPGMAGIVANMAGYGIALTLFAGCQIAAAIVILVGFRPGGSPG
jgi:MFS family permease